MFAEEVKEDVKEEPPKGALASLLRGEKPEVKAQIEDTTVGEGRRVVVPGGLLLTCDLFLEPKNLLFWRRLWT